MTVPGGCHSQGCHGYPSCLARIDSWPHLDRRPVSSVGRATDCCAGGRRFKPRPDQHSGSLNNCGERAAFVMTPANG